jgi:hypothetical protein
MIYRIDKEELLKTFIVWNRFLKKKVHLIACGGTAMTLLGVKESTKDIDLMAPKIVEYEYLCNILKQLGYKSASGWGLQKDEGFIFDIFRGNKIHTTELIESPLDKNNHLHFKEFSHLYIGILNYYDLIISKLFRGTMLDVEDCLNLFRVKKKVIEVKELERRYRETASYDISEEKVNKNFDLFKERLRKEGLL